LHPIPTFRTAAASLAVAAATLVLVACGGKENPETAYIATVEPKALSGSVTVAGYTQPWTATVTLDRMPGGNFNLGVVDADGVVAPASISVTPKGGTSYEVKLSSAGALSAGSYTGSLQLRACRDAVATCAKPLPGSPWQLPYTLSALPALASVENQCGSLDAQRKWVRSYVNDAYLWYRDVPTVDSAGYSTPTDYFDALLVRTPTASGQPRDRFSFAIDTATWNAGQVGQEVGYGLQASRSDDGVVRIQYVEPGSPAAAQGIARGDTILSVDGLSVATGPQQQIFAAFFPDAAGQTHSFTVQSLTGAQRTVSLTSAVVNSTPVLSTQVLNVGGARVGYVVFNDFVIPAQDQLIAAFQTLSAAQVDDLVLDLRYNGGGLVLIGAQLGYMIGGQKTEGKVFEQLVMNEKRAGEAIDNVLPFQAVRYDPVAGEPTATRLPTLDLGRVFVLTTENTCSASESVINGLRGVDIEVITLGSTTCGKPFGFTGKDNCGITYLPIEGAGVNAKGFGDFADGFAPTCPVGDDLSRPLGDPAEAMLAAALFRRATGQCPPAPAQPLSARAGSKAAPPEARLLRSPLRENKFHTARTGR
jgi:carboxyl-terminal processing protease